MNCAIILRDERQPNGDADEAVLYPIRHRLTSRQQRSRVNCGDLGKTQEVAGVKC
jgi:hypothetical protein